MNIVDIYKGAEILINNLIREELKKQGHYLTGNLDRSLSGIISKTAKTDTLSGFALSYINVLEQGLEPEQISFKMLPGLVAYFIKRGLSQEEALQAGKATIFKWMKEGLSTQASKRFSQTGARQHAVEAVFVGKQTEIDEYVLNTIEFSLQPKTKSETI